MYDDIIESEESDLCDWQLPLAFMKKRHIEKIEGGTTTETQSWRMKERVMTNVTYTVLTSLGYHLLCEHINLTPSMC